MPLFFYGRTMRKLQTQDIFKAMQIINACELKDDFKDMMEKVNNHELKLNDIGYEIIFKLMEKMTNGKTEKAIYSFVGGLLEISDKEVKEKELLEVISELKECADVEGWSTFFKLLSASTMK